MSISTLRSALSAAARRFRLAATLVAATFVAVNAIVVLAAGPALAQDADFKKKWDDLIKAAQAEGEVNVILFAGLNLQKLMPEFEKQFGVRVNFFTGSGRQHAQRILAERQAGRHTVDLWLGGANTGLTMLMPNKALVPIDELLFHPDVTDTSKWFQGKHTFSDPDGRYIFTWGGSPLHIFYLNTKVVNPEEITSFWDILNPKWKGKIVAVNPAAQGAGALTAPLLLMPSIGEEWFRRWATEMAPVIVENTRQGAEWVAIGRYPVGMFGLSDEIARLKAQGFPVLDYMPHTLKEGDILTASANNLMVLANAPHPHATKLFVNWFLTREVQQEAIRVGVRKDSLRKDVDSTVIEPPYRINHQAKYYVSFNDPAYINDQRNLLKRLSDIMKEAGFK